MCEKMNNSELFTKLSCASLSRFTLLNAPKFQEMKITNINDRQEMTEYSIPEIIEVSKVRTAHFSQYKHLQSVNQPNGHTPITDKKGRGNCEMTENSIPKIIEASQLQTANISNLKTPTQCQPIQCLQFQGPRSQKKPKQITKRQKILLRKLPKSPNCTPPIFQTTKHPSTAKVLTQTHRFVSLAVAVVGESHNSHNVQNDIDLYLSLAVENL
ncbi:LAME_0D06238g1_1 [Lachancea meyersii CBS 8951]|uniref:LAME_0D06238g1_1 n=1 Tax=Lachancea meyersii CBS 8951 TaxID=1266667 RepID=A0A1G4J9B8_9SACH|nr:LAME_0D06238g1_1 [Lachancea meyersii CBS 8951]